MMRATSLALMALAAALSGACSDPEPSDRATAAPAEAPVPTATSVAAGTGSPEEATAPPTVAPAEETREPESPLGEARAACAEGWAAFGEERLDDAGRTLDEAILALDELDELDRSVRRVRGACLYNRGRVEEARGQRDRARGWYARSLRYRANDVVLARWRTLAPTDSPPPATGPARVWRYLAERRRHVCRRMTRERLHPDDVGQLGVPRTCDAGLWDLAVDGDHVAVVVSDYRIDDDMIIDPGTFLDSPRLIALWDGARWTELDDCAACEGGVGRLDDADVGVSFAQLVPGGTPELVATLSYSYSYVPSANDGGGSYSATVVWAERDGAWTRVELCERSSDSEEPAECDPRAVLQPDGTVELTDADADVDAEPRTTTIVAMIEAERASPSR